MSTPEEDQLLASIQSMAEAMAEMGNQIKRQTDNAKNQYDAEVVRLADEKKQADERKKLEGDRLKEEALKNGRLKTSSNEEAQRNREISKQFRNRLGIEEEINPRLKKVLENRTTIEQRLVDAAKRQYGDDVFTSAQRSKLYREQLQQYSAGNLAYGGVVTQFKDFSKQQQDSIIDAAKTQKKLRMEQENLAQTVQALSHVKFEDLSKQQQDAAVEAVKTQQQLQKEQEKFTKTVQKLANPGDTFKDIRGKITSLSSALESGKDGLIKMAGGGVGAQIAFESIAVAGKALVAGFMSMSTSLYTGQRGAAVGVNALASAVDKVTPLMYGLAGALFLMGGPVLKILGVAAMAATAAFELFTEAQKKGAEQNDALFKSFNDLSQVGLATSEGLTGLFDMTQKLGLTVKEIEKLGPLLKANAKDLAMMGGTASDGAKAFANVANELKKSEIGEQLERLGITVDEQREHDLKWMAQQTRMGTLLNKTQLEQVAGAKNYMEELDKMAAITGVSRKEQELAMDAVLAEDQLRAAMFKAEQENNKGELDRLQTLAILARNIRNQGNIEGSIGIARGAALGGPTDDKSSAAYLTFKPALDAVNTGLRDQTKILSLAMGGWKGALGAMALPKAAGGDVGGVLAGTYANGVDKIKGYDKLLAAAKSAGYSDPGEYLEAEKQKKQGTPDAQLAANISAGRTQQAAAMLQDSLIKRFDQSAKINQAASEMFEAAVNKFNNIVGAKPPAGGTPKVEKSSKQEKSTTNINVSDETQTNYANAELLKNRKDSLEKSIADDEEKRTEAIRSGATVDERKLIDERINNAKVNLATITEEITANEKKVNASVAKDIALREKQYKIRREMQELESENKSAESKLGDLYEKKELLQRRRQSTGEVDKEISEVKTGITSRSEKINVEKSKLFSGEKTDVGEIGSFTKEQSKSYANAVAKKESGGDIGVENTLGYLGKYQFGAEALASVGILDEQKYAELKSQHMRNKEILNDSSVWAIPGGKEAFLKDEKLQDATFNKYTTMNLAGLQANNVVNKSTTPADTAGWLMAAHLKGVGGATKLSKGEDNADAYGTRASTYFAAGKQSLGQTVAAAPVTPAPTAAAPVTPAPTAAAPVTPAPTTAAPVTLAAKTEQTPIEPEFKTASQEEIDKTKAGRDNWFAKPKVAAVTPRPVAKAEPLPDPVADPKGYKAAVNARIMKSVSFSPVASVEEKTPQAKFGGLFNGPLSGYPVTLHGRETVTPMPNPNSLVASNEASTVQKEPLPTATPAAPTANADSGVLLELFKMLSDKMDTLSDHMASGNDTREELLKYSRV